MRKIVFLMVLAIAISAVPVFAGTFWDLGAGQTTGMIKTGGLVTVNQDGNAKIWTPSTGLVSLGAGSTAGVAMKGSTVIVAGKVDGNASRWDGNASGEGSWQTLPLADNQWNWTPTGVASDGTNVMMSGYSVYGANGYDHACRYKDNESIQWCTNFEMPAAANGQKYHDKSYFWDVSENDRLAGQGQYGNAAPSGGARQAMGGSPVVTLSNLRGAPSTSNECVANAISDDGSRIVGWCYALTVGNYQPCYWDAGYTTNQTPVAIPYPAGYYWGGATAVSSTGAYIGGFMWANGDTSQTAFIWDAVNGTRLLPDILAANGIVAPGQLSDDKGNGPAITGISTDGMWISGTGFWGDAQHAWVVNLAPVPEPSSFAALAIGILPLLKLRRRK